MPHLVIEYSETIEKTHSINELILACDKAANKSGLFGEKDIKVRAYPCKTSLVGGHDLPFIHVTVKLLSGRDQETKKSLTDMVLKELLDCEVPASSLTVEAVDIERETYSKVTK
ncbi:MAG: 5-carboxymethyl-2-hydroxymuconate Delta-isomerase [Kordiimonas sp.]